MPLERTEDIIEHCKILIMLLQKFPECTAQHGVSIFLHSMVELSFNFLYTFIIRTFFLLLTPFLISKMLMIENLLNTEKHTYSDSPVNTLRKLLVGEILPLVLKAASVDISQARLYNLLHKSIEYCVYVVMKPYGREESPLTGYFYSFIFFLLTAGIVILY